MAGRAIEQYLSRYAESETQLLDGFPQHCYDHCAVIPCFRETPAFAERLLTGPLNDKNMLVIVVINQSEARPQPLNQALLTFFSAFAPLWQNGHLRLCRNSWAAIHWLVVDRSQSPLWVPIKQGVGLARKIGCDIAVALSAKGMLISPWLHSTDADAHLPAGYLDLPSSNAPGAPHAAAVYPFEHIRAEASIKEWQATQLYEQALHYYVAGLRWARSPYAQHTIGSLLAFTVKAYCEVRGFPKRNAGEDFYLLNKLTKLGPVYTPQARVKLRARLSDRVPFGTGPKVKTITDLKDPATEYCYYSPAVFVQLKRWLDAVPHVWQALQSATPPLGGLPMDVQDALSAAGIERLWPHLQKQGLTPEACERAIHTWFDAFQTLKFIRRLQARAYPPLPLQQCRREAPFQC